MPPVPLLRRKARGWRLDDAGGPYRAGIDRLLDVRDYDAIPAIGTALSVFPVGEH